MLCVHIRLSISTSFASAMCLPLFIDTTPSPYSMVRHSHCIPCQSLGLHVLLIASENHGIASSVIVGWLSRRTLICFPYVV